MNGVSLLRLYILPAMYLFIVVGLGCYLWPDVIDQSKHWELMQGQATCMLAAFSLMSALGLRYPLQMLPVLLWEISWKTLWLGMLRCLNGGPGMLMRQSNHRSLRAAWLCWSILPFHGRMYLPTS
jgi:hypothetical protein